MEEKLGGKLSLNYPVEISPSLHIESQKISEKKQEESIQILKEIQSLIESRIQKYEEDLKNSEVQVKLEASRLNLTVEVSASLETLKKYDEIKIEKEKLLIEEKSAYNKLQSKLKSNNEKLVDSNKKYLVSQSIQLIVLIFIIFSLFFKFNFS
jgi:hypothetical protein